MPSRTFVAFDPLAILNRLRDVEYLVVGGFATITADLDIMPGIDEGNIARLTGVLATLHHTIGLICSLRRRG